MRKNIEPKHLVQTFARKSALLLALTLSTATAWAVSDKVTVNPATGGSAISADTTGGAWTTLTGPVATESLPGDIGTGTIILTAPSGFVFNAAAPVSVVVNGGTNANNNINGVANNTTVSATIAADGSSVTIAITKSSSSTPGKLTWQNLQVRPVAGTPLANGSLTESGSSSLLNLNLLGNTWGALAEIAGAPTQLAFVQQPTSTVIGTTISPTPVVSTADQFNNVSATPTNEVITVALGNNPTGATLSGTTSGNAKNAPVTLNTLSVSKVGTGYTLIASAPGFAPITSSPFDVTASPTTTSLALSGVPVAGLTQTFTATLSTNAATGTVTFMDGTIVLGTVPVISAKAVLPMNLPAGSHSITAIYNGDAFFASATSATQLLSIAPLLAPHIDCSNQNGQVQFLWDAQVGVTYQLQTSSDLMSGAWTNVGTPMTAASNSIICSDAMDSAAANSFFRVAVVP